jgi:putative mRNA 3-end processing factor
VTHAHADHARPGSKRYLASREGRGVLARRLGAGASIQTLEWGERLSLDGVSVSLHPAGHILGSAQVRVEHRGEVWVVSGDYKTEPDPTCAPYEAVRCDVFVTESTFGLPIYTWPPQREVFAEIDAWWRSNRDSGRASLLLAYSLGKAQRLLAGIDSAIGPIFTHGAVEAMNDEYRAAGIDLPDTTHVAGAPEDVDWSQALIVAPPAAAGSSWIRRFGDLSTGFASGWMRIRGARRWRSAERGFVLSDHVDWPALGAAIEATEAGRVWVTHGYREATARWLRERGLDAEAVSTRFESRATDEDDPGDRDSRGTP